MKKVGFVSLGCPKNLLDTEVMLGHLTRDGYELVARPEEAEVLVVNTCGFIDAAKQESIDTILEMARHKETGNCRRLVVTGCLAQRYSREIASEIPEVDVVFGLDQLHTITEACEGEERRVTSLAADGFRGVSLRSPGTAGRHHTLPLRLRQDLRGLRLSLHVLHHPEDSRLLPEP